MILCREPKRRPIAALHPRAPAAPLLLLALTCCGSLVSSAAAQAPPSTDILLVTVSENGEVGAPRPVTDRDGYDNQPMFLAENRLAFTAMKDDGTTDILVHDLGDGTTTTLVSTPESEYSPTPVPGGSALSVIRDYGDQVQQLWSFDLAGDGRRLLLPDVNPVGYHAWVDERRLLLFVLGEPATLRLATVGPGQGRVLARNPGRALARIPGSDSMSFVHKGPGDEIAAPDEWWLTAVDSSSGELRRLFRTLPGREDYAWSPEGSVWMADDSRLYRRTLESGEWALATDLASHGVAGITRLAFAPSGRQLAIVVTRPPPGASSQ